jgi:flagellar hook-associated protein 1 FlgK
MPSAFEGIEIGKRSLMAHSRGLFVVGHNLSNAAEEGYSRQRIEMRASPPIFVPGLNREERPGQMGQGVAVERIERVKDMLLEGRILTEVSGQGYWASRNSYILMLEQIYNEPTDYSIRALMDRFWEAWQDLSVRPDEMGARKAVIQRGKTLVDAIHHRYNRLKSVRDMLEDDLVGSVRQVNDLIRNIAALNEEIVKAKAMGDNPNDLLDRRDLLVGRLSKFMDVTIDERDPDEFTVHSGGIHIIQGRHFEQLDTEPFAANEGYSRIIWRDTEREMFFRAGKLAALVELRDADTRDEIQKLDLMALNFIDLVNEVHEKGFGLNGQTGLAFFVEYPFVENANGNYDRDGDGIVDSTFLFRISGTNRLAAKDQIGLRGTLILPGPLDNQAVDYFPADTVEDLLDRINQSGSEVVARLNRDGELSIKGTPAADGANPEFVIRHLEDSGEFLVGYAGMLGGSGSAGAFTWTAADQVDQLQIDASRAVAPLAHPSGWIDINRTLVSDPRRIAAATENGSGKEGDGSTALAVAGLRTEIVMIGQAGSFDDYFAAVVADVGLRGEQAATAVATEELILKELNDLKVSLSGVNIDEELANMIKFQQAYSSAARFISEVDRMLDIIINRMGV